jgi:hypothetical protein
VCLNGDAPATPKTDREHAFDIVDTLCGRFTGLSPLEVVNADLATVMGLYVDVVIHDSGERKTQQQDVWVTSKTATWH